MKFLIKSFAKINLSLLVYRPRKDGYHPICSVFQSISLADEMEVQICTPGFFELKCSHPEVPTDGTNLIAKAYEGVSKKLPFGVKVTLNKKIPLGGGLGGGSSNAGAFLRFVLDRVPHLEKLDIARLAKQLGADVPFFLSGGTALVRGIGEKLTPVKPGIYRYFVLVNPGIHCDTRTVYTAFDKQKNLPKAGPTPRAILKTLLGPNSLQPIVFEKWPEFQILEAFVVKRKGVLHLSGSGATCFIPCLNWEDAGHWEALLKKQFPNYWIDKVESVPEASVVSVLSSNGNGTHH